MKLNNFILTNTLNLNKKPVARVGCGIKMNEISRKLIDEIEKFDCLEVVKHNNDSGFINVRCTTSIHPRRINVIGDLNTNTGNMKLYSDGNWISVSKLGITSVEAIISWVKKDIELLTSQRVKV
jgi:hypothetical protein